MKSIRQDMAVTMGTAAVILLVAGGFGLYFSLREALTAQFDQTLRTKTQALVTASEVDDDEFEIDLDVQAFAGFGSRWSGDYFEIRTADGEVMQRSPSLVDGSLPAASALAVGEREYANIELPGGAPGRAYWKRFTPSDDDDGEYPDLQIVVASDITAMHRTLGTVALVIALFGILVLVVTLVILRLVLNAGLRPLERLGSEVQAMDAGSLRHRLPIDTFPAELSGIVAKLNELLDRLEISFARERRFSSDAAHELRTPLAELKVMTELGTRWPEEFTPGHGREMLEVIAELEELLDKLSMLARADSGKVVEAVPVDLETSLADCLERLSGDLASRNLQVETAIEHGEFHSEPVLWRSIVSNLLGNAAAYAPNGSRIGIAASPRHFSVSNEAPDLETDDLAHLFERFWRKSAARSERKHSGLGLFLVKSSVELLGGTCEALLEKGRLEIRVEWE